MQRRMDVDWSWFQTFVSAAKAGSFTAAAENLGLSQATVSRHVQALEEHLGVALFVRHARGLALTERGAELLGTAQGLGVQVDALVRRATGMREVPAGDVRVSANEPIGVHVLMPCLAKLRAKHPDVHVELVIDNRSADLRRREADIAVRMFEPRQLDLIAKRIGEVSLGLFASRAYVKRHGKPCSLADRAEHTLIGFDHDPDWARQIREVGLTAADFIFRTDSLNAQIAAMVAGVGIAGTHVRIGERLGLVRVMPDLPLKPLPVWLVTHEELRTSAAVRVVFDALEQHLRRHVDEDAGEDCDA